VTSPAGVPPSPRPAPGRAPRSASPLRLPRITYHALHCPEPGHYVVPRGPRSRVAYLVHAARAVVPRPGSLRGPAWLLEVHRVARDDVPADARTWPMVWFERGRRPHAPRGVRPGRSGDGAGPP
jgi:hypothetical protein